MNRILDLIYGYVEILVQGENPERFLNLCKNRNIYMEKSVIQMMISLLRR